MNNRPNYYLSNFQNDKNDYIATSNFPPYSIIITANDVRKVFKHANNTTPITKNRRVVFDQLFIILFCRSNGQLKNTLNKARTLCDKWRGSGGIGGGPRLSLDGTIPGDTSPQNQANQGRLSRWFSIRRGSSHQYDLDNTDNPQSNPNKMPLLPEVIIIFSYVFLINTTNEAKIYKKKMLTYLKSFNFN